MFLFVCKFETLSFLLFGYLYFLKPLQTIRLNITMITETLVEAILMVIMVTEIMAKTRLVVTMITEMLAETQIDC